MYDFKNLKQWKSIVKGSREDSDGVKVVPAHSGFEAQQNGNDQISKEVGDKVDLATLVDLLAAAGEQNQAPQKNIA